MKRYKKYTDESFKEAVKDSSSIAQVLKKINLIPVGGNYGTVKRNIFRLELDTSHFTGQGYLKGKTHNWAKKIPLEEILVKESSYTNSDNLRKRLIKEGIFEAKCYKCNLTEWLGEPISLELEHISGIKTDNRRKNLTILCPNCHAQTPTYRRKKKKL